MNNKNPRFCHLNSFNPDLNRGCFVYMLSLRFSGSKFLINSRRQFRVRKNFSRWQLSTLRQFFRDLQPFYFVYEITKNLCVIKIYG